MLAPILLLSLYFGSFAALSDPFWMPVNVELSIRKA